MAKIVGADEDDIAYKRHQPRINEPTINNSMNINEPLLDTRIKMDDEFKIGITQNINGHIVDKINNSNRENVDFDGLQSKPNQDSSHVKTLITQANPKSSVLVQIADIFSLRKNFNKMFIFPRTSTRCSFFPELNQVWTS